MTVTAEGVAGRDVRAYDRLCLEQQSERPRWYSFQASTFSGLGSAIRSLSSGQNVNAYLVGERIFSYFS